MTEATRFPCTSCGACCRRTGVLLMVGLPIQEDGSCAHLDGSRCGIYETRPQVCRVDEVYEALGRPDPTLADYHRRTAAICNEWQAEDGIDESFRVKIDQEEVL